MENNQRFISLQKARIRDNILVKRNKLTDTTRNTGSSIITSRLIKMQEFLHAKEIFTYVSFGSEVNTFLIIKTALQSNKKVYVPKIIKKGIMEFFRITSITDLKEGMFHIMEPTGNEKGIFLGHSNQLLILPGVAFDVHGNRIGYGGGYYDRYLQSVTNKQISCIGIAFEMQMMDEIPTEPYDQRLDCIMTEKRNYYKEGEGEK